MSEPLHTVQQAAERLKLHPKTVLRLIREGRLRGARIGKSYRIQDSDLRAFAGIAAGAAPAPLPARATCVVEVEAATREAFDRISVLGAAALSGRAGGDPVQVTSAYDPERQTLKLVLIGQPADVAGLLRILDAQLENLR